MSVGFTQRMDGSLRRAAPGDQNLPICPRLFRRPQQKGPCAAPIWVAIQLAMPVEIAKRRRIWVVLVKSAYCVGVIAWHQGSRLFRRHLIDFSSRLFPSPRNRGEGDAA